MILMQYYENEKRSLISNAIRLLIIELAFLTTSI